MPNSITESICPPETQFRRREADPVRAGETPAGQRCVVIELRVRNHPGAMSHITGLFARRAFNLEAIACAPVGDGTESRMLLLLRAGANLDQIERQLEKLYDVLSVRHREDLGADFFARCVGA